MNPVDSIDLRALQFFIAVYEAQSFSEVARREGVSASMVSRVIQQLEDALGQQLFYRNTRAVIPSEAGRLFIDFARSMTGQMADAQRLLHERNQQPAGLIRINAPLFFGHHHIARWLPGLTARYPALQVSLNLTDDYTDPHRDASDLLFRIGTLSDSSFHARIIATQRYHLVASPAYIRKHGTPESLAALDSHRCLVYRGSSGPNKWFFRDGQAPWIQQDVTPFLTSNSAESLLTAALGGMGIVLFPDWLIGDSLKRGRLVTLLPEYEAAIAIARQQIAALYPNTRHPSRNVRATIDYFIEIFGEPPYWQ